MNPPLAERSRIRMNARLDAATRQKVDELATRFHQPRATVLGYIMQWGLNHGQTGPIDQGELHGTVCHLYCDVASDLYAQVEKAATTAGVNTAPWLRHMVRLMTMTDFPASWQEARPAARSHDSCTYGTRFMLRLDNQTREKLEELSTHFDTSAAEVIRQLVAQATPKDFPKRWHMRAAERRADQPRR